VQNGYSAASALGAASNNKGYEMLTHITNWVNAALDMFCDWLSGNSEDEDREIDDAMRWRH
jgi:hypothetical protein